jgi:hypothetical protein
VKHIQTGDKSWVHCFQPRASKEWHCFTLPKPRIPHTFISRISDADVVVGLPRPTFRSLLSKWTAVSGAL